MGGLSNLDAIYAALAFLVPGFVLSAVRNQFITGQERQGSEQLIRFLTFSAINCAAFGWVLYLAISAYAPPAVKAAAWLFVVLIAPVLLGLLSGAAAQKGWARKVCQWLKLQPVHVMPTAWDYKFAATGGEWVIVTLKDGTRFSGWFGAASFSSSDAKERDLYLQAVFDVDNANVWHPTGKSVLIGHGEIRTVEFIPHEQEKQCEQGNAATAGTERAEGLPATAAVGYAGSQRSGRPSADDWSVGASEPAEPGEQWEEVTAERVTGGR